MSDRQPLAKYPILVPLPEQRKSAHENDKAQLLSELHDPPAHRQPRDGTPRAVPATCAHQRASHRSSCASGYLRRGGPGRVRRCARSSSRRAGDCLRGIAIARPAPRPTRKQSRGSCHDATTGVIEMSPLRSSAPGRSRRSRSRNAIVAPPAWFRRNERGSRSDRSRRWAPPAAPVAQLATSKPRVGCGAGPALVPARVCGDVSA